jgi:[acyl-carrier-protein] S-malonyltransferase
MSKRGIIFSGQGAQFVGMGKDLADAFPACKALYEKADEVLGYELSKICFEGPAEELTKSNHCQPAIFVTSIACYTALKEKIPNLEATMTAGLSLGEWSALHAAGALTFEDTLRVLETRGRAMQDACEERDGSMVSVIGLSMDQLNEICKTAGVELANLNSEAQTVLSGEREAIEKAAAIATEMGAKRAIVLQVAGAFHSSLMASATPKLEAVLNNVTINEPSIPVLANVTGQVHGSPDEIRATMLKQVTGSVHWYESINAMTAAGVSEFIECGPGNVLTGLIKRIAERGTPLHNVQDMDTLEKSVAALAG